MFNWLKKLLGTDIPDTPVIAQDPKPEAKVKKVKPSPNLKKSETENIDLDSMNKTQLLAEAKKRGVKANSSLKKDEILNKIKNG